MAFYAGFDTMTYPGDDMMAWLKANSNLTWCGYYLAPAPNRSPTGWPGTYNALKDSWAPVPIYVGQQDPSTAHGDYTPSSILTADQGTRDGQDAANLAAGDAFPAGTYVFLDWESGSITAAGAKDYILAWMQSVLADGRMAPGIYCSHAVAPQIAADLDGLRPACDVRFWCWMVTNADPHPCQDDLTGVPAPDPAGCGFTGAVAWQREQQALVTLPEGAPTSQIELDFSSSISAQPASGAA